MRSERAMEKTRVGGAARGYSWPAFETGNTVSVRHGAYARLQLSEPAAITADVLRDLVPLSNDADEAIIQAFALVLEQLKCAATALEDAGSRAERLELSRDARAWTGKALAFADALGMTPTSRARLGLDLARAHSAASQVPVDGDTLDLSKLHPAQRARIADVLLGGDQS